MKYPDQGFSRNILAAFIDADLRLVLIVSAIGLILWALMGIAYPQGVVELVNLLSFGSYEFWIGNCLITGFSMIYCVGRNFPSLFSHHAPPANILARLAAKLSAPLPTP